MLKGVVPHSEIILFSMHTDDFPKSMAAIGVDLALSKSDGITKLGEHLKALLALTNRLPFQCFSMLLYNGSNTRLAIRNLVCEFTVYV